KAAVEGDGGAFQSPQTAGFRRGRGVGPGLYHSVGPLVPLPALADTAIHDLLQVIGADEPADFRQTHSHPRVALDQHPQQLTDLIHVVTRLPAWNGALENVAGRCQRVHRARGDAPTIALLSHDAEVSELEALSVAHEHVQRREIAMERLSPVKLPEHFENAGDLAPRCGLGPSLARTRQERAQVAVTRVLER